MVLALLALGFIGYTYFTTLSEENSEAAAEAEATAAANAATQEALTANYQENLTEAQTQYNQMIDSATLAQKENELNLQSNIDALKYLYGYTNDEGTQVLGTETLGLIADYKAAAQASSSRLAKAGMSGVKMSGSVEAQQKINTASEQETIAAESTALSAQASSAAVKAGNAYAEQELNINQTLENAQTLYEKWNGSASSSEAWTWDTFLNSGSSLSKQYTAAKLSNDASAMITANEYEDKLDETDPYNIFNYFNLFKTGLSLTSQIAALAG